jgi:squalene-hopene/tetraprenyl-beta-curcumene cyclase
MSTVDTERQEEAYQTALATLLAARHPLGYWLGELSTSALSTATAVSALALVLKQTSLGPAHDHLITGGLKWLTAHQNPDGGWGDTTRSISNISTSMLARAAFHLAGAAGQHADCLRRAEEYLQQHCGRTPPEQAEAIRTRYGKDRTFAVPILTTCALAGLVSWDEVDPLPFELACLPQAWFRLVRLHVVSYALPALIAIGQAVYHHRPPRNPLTRLVRRLSIERSLHVLDTIQPSSGGFLEAIPLTSFVTLSLASIGRADHPVAKRAVEFLIRSVRPDGSWAIDSNLSTWVTTLSVNALAAAGELTRDNAGAVGTWIAIQQFSKRHPYTGAAPGGWGWTDLPGSVPDADDTPGALLALRHLPDDGTLNWGEMLRDGCDGASRDVRRFFEELADHYDALGSHASRVVSGIRWLLALQNWDGGWPTFCRGWGHLPFDRSGADLTAHVLRALAAWKVTCERDQPSLRRQFSWGSWLGSQFFLPTPRQLNRAIDRGMDYLARQQRPDGSWLPLWFGNQYAPNDENPTYGTARVLAAYRDLDKMNSEPARRGVGWLLGAQNADGGWGGANGVASSIEETALAVEVLLDASPGANTPGSPVNKGLAWLVQQVEAGGLDHPTPMGFYFAKLWYFEKLYPVIFTVAALGRARRVLSLRRDPALRSSTP